MWCILAAYLVATVGAAIASFAYIARTDPGAFYYYPAMNHPALFFLFPMAMLVLITHHLIMKRMYKLEREMVLLSAQEALEEASED